MIKFLQPVSEDKIYHYSTLRTFKSILESQSLQLTHISYLNDLTEFKDGIKFVGNFLRSVPDNRQFEELINLNEKALLHGGKISDFCVFSFCLDGNLLNQWRAYGQDGFGIAIGFDTKLINNICDEKDFFFGECFYSEESKKKACNVIFESLHNIQEIKEKITFFWMLSAIFALFSKNVHFREEKEARIATLPGVELNIKEKDNGLVAFHCLDIKEKMINLIKEIIIGPCHRDRLDEMHKTLEVVLQKAGISSCVIKESDIPYRSYKIQ